ncbi:exodeoxyribonuclease-1 [Pseudomonas nitritireducens]|uniref:Exodeoxyribonuclease I n=1 Tax=Pseudomonas nitroreducens TaxID=46680 RepID=A0A7W7NYF4_PSENT|nr:exodeoxyribonuclease I [Pseudomonas nitritireducens]MBB4861396.1 exodeoxyribonuclease-1 [Pseudomonas nitritireducens]
MNTKSFARFCAYDYESGDLSVEFNQPVQFAGLAFDQNLEPIPGDELVMDIKLRADVVPSPFAFSITGIGLDRLSRSQNTEWDAAGHIQKWFMAKRDTCIAGFNTQSFDDEMSRYSFYRNHLDPYEHEWKNGNFKTDIYRLAMMVNALRPEALNFLDKDGVRSLKLGDLCEANGISLTNAHDALADVTATVELARLIKRNNERLWNYFLGLSDKKSVAAMVTKYEPIALVDRFISRERQRLAVVIPIGMESKGIKMVSYDLSVDPRPLVDLDLEELRRRMFTSSSALNEGEKLNVTRMIEYNKAPMISALNIFTGREDVTTRAGIDLDMCKEHARILSENPELKERLIQAYDTNYGPPADTYTGLYSMGFINGKEPYIRSDMRRLEAAPGGETSQPAIIKADPLSLSRRDGVNATRVYDLALRAKWSNFEDIVRSTGCFTEEEERAWAAHMKKTWIDGHEPSDLTVLERFKADLEVVRARELPDHIRAVLDELEAYVEAKVASTIALVARFPDLDAQVAPAEETAVVAPAAPKNPASSDLSM